MAWFRNNAEGQPNTTVLSTGNSGGTSGDAFNTVDSTGTGSITFSSVRAMHGRQSYLVVTNATATDFIVWTGANDTSAAARVYLMLNANPASTSDFVTIRNSGGTAAKLQINGSGAIQVTNAAGTGLDTFTPALTANVFYRLEMQVIIGADTSTGTIRAQLYLGDSTTALDSYSSSTVNAGTTNITEVRMGKITSATATANWYMDDLALNSGTSTPIGPTGSVTMNNYQFIKGGNGISFSERIK